MYYEFMAVAGDAPPRSLIDRGALAARPRRPGRDR
jgi:hypothetical protein